MNIIREHILESLFVKKKILNCLTDNLLYIAKMISYNLFNGNKLYVCGNGGSASDSQHFVSELVNRYDSNRSALPAICLSSNVPLITSISNDYSYDFIFSKQIKCLANNHDILFVITTSGNSKNIVNAIKEANKKKMKIILLTGNNGGDAKKLIINNKNIISIPSNKVMIIQEAHIMIIHCLCDVIEKEILLKNKTISNYI